MLKYTSVFFVIQSINLFAQLSVNSDSLFFSQTNTGTSDSVYFYVKNNYSQAFDIKITNLKNVYNLSDNVLTLPANDSSIIWVKYNPQQNVIDRDLVFVTSDDSTTGIILEVYGSGRFNDNYDATTFNLYDTELKNTLTQLVIGHSSLGYNTARDNMYMVIDNQRVNGQGATQNTLECVYTGRLAVGYVDRTDAQNNYNFNTEHTWPQSNFGEQEPMKSDLYHLFPTDNPANAVRSNFPFGKVVSNITWQLGGSKLGLNSLGQTVFEPRDLHKGDVSRSMFYFITRYPVNYGNFFTLTQENIFREWNKLDVVGAVEMARNNAIASLQLKRNPFIDHTEFADRIYSFSTNNVRPVLAELSVLPLELDFDSTLINTSNSKQIYIANSGSAQLIIDSITISDSRFSILNVDLSTAPFSSTKAMLEFHPDSIKNYSAILSVYTNGGIKEIVLKGIGSDNTVNVDDKSYLPLVFSLEQNYPNPFNPSTIINYQLPLNSNVSLIVYDLLGRKIATLVNEQKPAGNYEAEWNASNLPSGFYIYRLRIGNFVQMKKMILLK